MLLPLPWSSPQHSPTSVSMYGSYWDHVLGYWKASLERPDKLMFLTYEDLVEDTVLYLKKIAEFMGYPFSSEEQQQGVPENIVQMCSFENLSGLEVNKIGKHREGQGNLEFENNIYFRKGKVGDWKNYLTTEMSQRLDQRTLQKLKIYNLFIIHFCLNLIRACNYLL
ncbi:hypothetical protein ES319_D05G415900v1 [Gossypium barbadense]|uniref:Sulfotransferase n=1 Tax=Gossypium barbadense TaxID=3634 RepID=A0A5J5RNG9_GOSBA|nr:hypothetical protein ES319_D05G415900v1 [Gossypium barbadense]